VLFTLGLVSVVALLIVGWIMTQGGLEGVANKASNLTNIDLRATQSPTPVEKSVVQGPTTEQLLVDLQSKLQTQKDKYETQLESQQRAFQSQISDLKMQIQILKDENQRLRGEK
jgi:predicted RNase H-like nuclease (RuvC/YqgF family)